MTDTRLHKLVEAIDARNPLFENLRGATSFGAYLAATSDRADEEHIVEPIFRELIRDCLGFPLGQMFEQLSRDGSKPDFTPLDLVAHPFVLDAKSTTTGLGPHEPQIRRYMKERALNSGVLFSLRELRVYRAGEKGHATDLSFAIEPLWRWAKGETVGEPPEVAAFLRFCDRFAYRPMGLAEMIGEIRRRESWTARPAAVELAVVDVDYLVARLKKLSVELQDDAGKAAASFDPSQDYAWSPARERKLIGELQMLALDLAPGTKVEELPTAFEAWRDAVDGLPHRVWRQYLMRVAYMALARILLYRSWEDVGFVDEYLFDGGFGRAYDHYNQNLRKVLDEAFRNGRDEYRWLFGDDNNYDWYRPGDKALIDVLYALVPVPLGRLDADVLGSLYESYADEIDRDRRGQFFTPRSVVRFMLDRVGFHGPEGVFRVEGDTRKPLQVLDFATGSGGFLVECARRVISVVSSDPPDEKALREGLNAIVRGFVGSEISPFPYYLTEINLLLQVSRLLGALRSTTGKRESAIPALGVLHVDTLTAKRKGQMESFAGLAAEHRKDEGVLPEDERFDLVPLDGDKRDTWRERLWQDGSFDLVVGNPPYVSESDNKILFDLLKRISAWKSVYRGKTDYLYYFLLLGLEKLKPGGRIAVIVPAGWMNAGKADFLRERMAKELTIDELFLFGSYKVFATEAGGRTPTIESLVVIGTKAPPPVDHLVRVVALEDEGAAPKSIEALLNRMAERASGADGRSEGIHVHDVFQSTFQASMPWPVKHREDDLPGRTVAHLVSQMEATAAIEPLAKSWKIFLGIQTGADSYTPKIRKRLSADVQATIAAAGKLPGDPIYALPPAAIGAEPWSSYPGCLVQSPEPEGVLYGAIDPMNYVHLVWLSPSAPPPPAVEKHLESWKVLLSARAEFSRIARRKWWETHRPRSREELNRPKVIALHRTDRGRFALDEEGHWSPSGRMSVVISKSDESPVAYLCGLLNSELLDLWYSLRGRTPRDVWRDYEPLPMGQIPYRRPNGDPRADRIAELVREVAANRLALLPHRPLVQHLSRIVKDPWRTGPVLVDLAALLAGLPVADTISVRLDTALVHDLSSARGRIVRVAPGELSLINGKTLVGHVQGPADRLDLLQALLPDRSDGTAVGATVLPRSLTAFDALAAAKRDEVQGLLDEGRRLVEEIERLVCALYDVPDELADEVIAHAVARAARATNAEGSDDGTTADDVSD